MKKREASFKQGLIYPGHILQLLWRVPQAERFWKFAGVGGGVMLAGAGILYLLVGILSIEKNLSNFIMALITIETNFWLNNAITWHDRRGSGLLQRLVRFHAVKVITVSFNAGLFFFLVTVLSVHYMIAFAVGLSITTLLNYLANEYIVFQKPDTPRAKTVAMGWQGTLLRLPASVRRFGKRYEADGLPVLGKAFAWLSRLFYWLLFKLLPLPSRFTVEGHRLAMSRATASIFKDSIGYGGVYEPGTTWLLKRLIKPGMVVVDIGAHIGYFTLLAARLVGSGGRVFALEPDPRNYVLLTQNISRNGGINVTPVPKAVSNRCGETSFFMADDSCLSSLWNRPQSRRQVEVDTTTLDGFIKDSGVAQIDLVRMDTEGAEMAILQGMTGIIASTPALRMITEFNPKMLIRAGVRPEDYLDRAKSHGFHIYFIDEEGCSIEPWSDTHYRHVSKTNGNCNLLLSRDAVEL